jgi:D-aminoacyl-tRNA deacylase
MILLVSSNKDVASQNIKTQILCNYPFKQISQSFQQNPVYTATINNQNVILVTLSGESVKAQELPSSFPDAKLVVFISRHSSQSGKPTLSVHAPGNFAQAELGGLPRLVSVAPASAMSVALKALQQNKSALKLNYEISYECTHHGPSLSVPTMFVELGSSEIQWQDSIAAQAVANAAMEAVSNFACPAASAVLGIGGPHYNEKFTRMALTGKAIFGHMIPKYAVPAVDSEILLQCAVKTLEKVSGARLDWKGIKSEDKPKLLENLQEADIHFEKV